MTKRVLATLTLLLMIMPAAYAQEDAPPTVAIIRFGSLPPRDISEGGILDVLESYGYLSPAENRILEERVDHAGENLQIIWGDANFDFSNIGAVLDIALDAEPDVLITFGAPVTLAALNATLDMDEPPSLLFTNVRYPYEAGIAASACIKPDHATGTEVLTAYNYVFDALLEQAPDLQRVGIIYSTTEAGGVHGAAEIAAIAESHGIHADQSGVVSVADLRAAASSLLESGAGALILPVDSVGAQGLPLVVTVANEYGVPVFYPSLGAVYYGATIGAGYSRYYEAGTNIGVLLAHTLSGELDIARTAINIASGGGLGINMDSADTQGLEVAPSLVQRADAVYRAGRTVHASPALRQSIAQHGVIIPLEERQEKDQALLQSLYCTDAMIAEQQAALDAASP